MSEPPRRPVALTAMAHVADVPRAMAFYQQLGFEVANTFTPPGHAHPAWAWLTSERADLMVTQADGPVDAAAQAVLFYLYCDDVHAYRAQLVALGITCGPVQVRHYAPRGEFRLEDPDGYVVMVSHT